MKKHLSVKIIAVGLGIFISSCDSNPKPEQKAAPMTETTPSASEEIKIELASLADPTDLVCGMSLATGIGDTASFNGKLYGFCSEGCKKDFLAEPAKYMKQDE